LDLPVLNNKLSSIFSAKNSKRTYNIHFKGEKGTILFKEYAKKEWVLNAFMKTARLLKKDLIKDNLLKAWIVDDKDKLNWLTPQIKPYIQNVQDNVKKKFKNFLIFKHEIEKMEFEEIDSKTYEIRVYVNIWVSV